MPAKPPRKPPPHPLDVIRRAKALGVRQAIVGISGGKDSLVTLDLCAQHFDRISGYFCYLIPGLSFQEKFLAYIERRYSLTIHRLPHFGLAALLRSGTFRYIRYKSIDAAQIKPRHVDAYLRKLTGMEWIATGEKAIDSVERNAMIRNKNGIDEKRRRIWPLAFWSHSTVYNHLKSRSIVLPPEYSQLTAFNKMRSFGSLWYRDVAWIKEKYPEDFDRICELFPLLPGQITRHRERERRRAECESHAKSSDSASQPLSGGTAPDGQGTPSG